MSYKNLLDLIYPVGSTCVISGQKGNLSNDTYKPDSIYGGEWKFNSILSAKTDIIDGKVVHVGTASDDSEDDTVEIDIVVDTGICIIHTEKASYIHSSGMSDKYYFNSNSVDLYLPAQWGGQALATGSTIEGDGTGIVVEPIDSGYRNYTAYDDSLGLNETDIKYQSWTGFMDSSYNEYGWKSTCVRPTIFYFWNQNQTSKSVTKLNCQCNLSYGCAPWWGPEDMNMVIAYTRTS